MRQIIISNSYTNENIEIIISYVKKLVSKFKIDNIIINGNVLGYNEIKKDYGLNYDQKLFMENLNKEEILKKIAPNSCSSIIEIINAYKNGDYIDDQKKQELGHGVTNYIEERYDYLIKVLEEFSKIKKTFYNLGKYESPFNNYLLRELSFFLDVDYTWLKKTILYAKFRDIYQNFKNKLNSLESNRFRYIGGKPIIEKGYILAGIPCFNPNSVPTDRSSELQENITKDLISAIKRHFSYSKKLIFYNTTKGRLSRNPFSFKPGSASIRRFIKEVNNKLSRKIFVQSYYNWVTTHFYKKDDFIFLLNNSASNNALFNILEISRKINCYDVDPNLEKIRKLNLYDSYLADYSNGPERLALNYKNPDQVINERNIEGCYYM